MKNFLKRKNVNISAKTYLIDATGAMAYGLFASLLVGTILNTIGNELNIRFLTDIIWPLAKSATGPAIAIAIAYSLNAPDLVLFSSAIVGIAGNELGGPVGVYISTIIAVELGKIISKETKLDIIITPVVTVLSGVFIANFIGPYIQSFMLNLGDIIMFATKKEPFTMGVLVSVIVGITLTLPISSAALCMMLSLSGLAAGAATVGCSAQMIGFAVISYKANGFEGFMAQGIGTSMLQIPNIIKNPKIWIPPTIASAVLGPVSTIMFKMENSPLGAGMGTSGLVGQIETYNTMSKIYPPQKLFLIIILLHIILPAIISLAVFIPMKKMNYIKDEDLCLVKKETKLNSIAIPVEN